MVARSKAWVCGCSLAGIVGSNQVYNERANRKVVGACCSVYVAECSESSG